MRKRKNRSRHRYEKRNDLNSSYAEINTIREQQKQQHQMMAQNTPERNRRHPPSMQINVLLEDGASFNGKAIFFSNPNMPKCRIFFKDKNRRELAIDSEAAVQPASHDKLSVLQSAINNYLMDLHKEAILEFPAWLEKYGTRADGSNPYFNLDEIREEFKYKKSRFGLWRLAAQLGFFNDTRPQYANFNKVVHLEIQ